eukprot:1147401-Pelagomonas_calceolata.AAC.2
MARNTKCACTNSADVATAFPGPPRCGTRPPSLVVNGLELGRRIGAVGIGGEKDGSALLEQSGYFHAGHKFHAKTCFSHRAFGVCFLRDVCEMKGDFSQLKIKGCQERAGNRLATMIESGQLISLRCFYDKSARKFYSVAKMGKDVAGYPGLVHGGLTAALLDETFGGLSVNVWKSGGFGVAPGYTARLEVDYKQKVPTGSTVVYCAELESIGGSGSNSL